MGVLILITLRILQMLVVIYGQTLRVGGLFEAQDVDDKSVFELAIKLVNNGNPRYSHHLTSMPIEVPHSNTLVVAQSVCSMLEKGIVGLVGPTSEFTSPQVGSLCDVKDIPLINIHWDPTVRTNDCVVNLYPNPPDLARSYVTLVRAWGWGSFTILYENDDGLFRIQELLSMYNPMQHTVTLRQLEKDGDHRNMLISIKHTGEKHFFIDCSLSTLEDVLEQAQQVGIMTEDYKFIIANLDISTVDLTSYQYGGSNITGVRLINTESPVFKDIEETVQTSHNIISMTRLKTQTALVIDAVYLLRETLQEFREFSTLDARPMHCNDTGSWEKGSSIINIMRAKTIEGITGTIRFDAQDGVRKEFTLGVMELSSSGLVPVGTWSSVEGLHINRKYVKKPVMFYDEENPLRHEMFKVIIALTSPYGMRKNVSSRLIGNDQYEGFAIDLFRELSRMLQFNYTFIVQEDGANGDYDHRTKQWTGMIGEVIAGRADFAITDLTITSERAQFVDFTTPFMNLGISILYKKPKPVPPSLFTFAYPFSGEVWLLLAVAFFLVSLSLFIMGRLSPSEWTNPYPCVEEPPYLLNQFSLRNSLWFTLGSLMQQGTEVAPLSISTRMAAGVWYFFTLILVSSYTANLVAFLAVEEYVTPFTDVEELASQTKIKYGAKAKGATYGFFRDSNYSVYPTIQRFMDSHTDCMTSNNDEGVEKVEKEDCAFFMESTTIEYVIERHCDLAQVGGALDEKGYGIAMQKGSKYRHRLTTAVLDLQESGKLTELKTKWWKEKGSENCQKPQAEAAPLDLQNVGGVFFVLGIGAVCALIGTLIEMSIHTYKSSHKEKLSFKKEVKKELKFFVNFKHTVKDTRKYNEVVEGFTG